MEEEKNDDSRINIFGYSKSRLEVFINGIVFLCLHVAHEVFTIYQALPGHSSKEEAIKEMDIPFTPFLVSSVLLLISYLLFNMAIFGGEGRRERLVKKYGGFTVLIRTYALILSVIFVSLFVPMYIIIIFF